MDETFLEDIEAGRIQFRDRWQFELKSELYPFAQFKEADLIQEFYFFIPNSLQINDQTYTKAQFYQDQTNLIRLKTPVFSFRELNDPLQEESPLVRIRYLLNHQSEKLSTEIKLFGSVFHTSLRNWTFAMLATPSPEAIVSGCQEIEQILSHFRDLQAIASNSPWLRYFNYVDEYSSLNVNDYLLSLMEKVGSDNSIQKLVLRENAYREKHYPVEHPQGHSGERHDEYLLYRKGLLSKFVIDPQLLKTSRASVDQRYRTLIGSIPAAIAMSIFLLLYVWQGNWFIINSEPFILFTVLLYVLKDRLKEELRYISYRQVAKWFSDYKTDIQSVENIGTLREYAVFIEEKAIPSDILEVRNRHFHQVLEEIKRPERVLYYKKSIKIDRRPETLEERFYGLNIFFRFEIHHFLAKAEDPIQTYLSLDGQKLIKMDLPRVYHLNIIMKSRKHLPDGTPKEELIKYRLVLDKNGIKRIEEV